MIKDRCELKAEVKNLVQANEFLETVYEQALVPLPTQFKINLAFEELFVNICSYAYENEGDIVIECQVDDDEVLITFIDTGIPFDPLKREDPNTKAKLEDRTIGGLGIFLVKQHMDRFEYEREDNKNINRIGKKL